MMSRITYKMTFFHEPGLRFPCRLLGVFIETGDGNPAVHSGEEVAHSFIMGCGDFSPQGLSRITLNRHFVWLRVLGILENGI